MIDERTSAHKPPTPSISKGTLSNSPSDPYGYNAQSGYYLDRQTGKYLCQNRYYDPAQGRFFTRDPIGFKGGINLYGYCKTLPINRVDYKGLQIEEEIEEPFEGPEEFLEPAEQREENWEDIPLRAEPWPMRTDDPISPVWPRRPSQIPENWSAKPSIGPGGVIYFDPDKPSRWVRLMPGNPCSKWEVSRSPYVRIHDGNRFLDRHGNYLNSETMEQSEMEEASHVSVQDWADWTEAFAPHVWAPGPRR